MDLGIEWCDPPDQVNKPLYRPWTVIAAELKTKPGQWCLVDKGSNVSLAPRIKSGARRCWQPKGDFDATMRFIGGRIYTWARYIGGEPS